MANVDGCTDRVVPGIKLFRFDPIQGRKRYLGFFKPPLPQSRPSEQVLRSLVVADEGISSLDGQDYLADRRRRTKRGWGEGSGQRKPVSRWVEHGRILYVGIAFVDSIHILHGNIYRVWEAKHCSVDARTCLKKTDIVINLLRHCSGNIVSSAIVILHRRCWGFVLQAPVRRGCVRVQRW